jgi:hypothetical protein
MLEKVAQAAAAQAVTLIQVHMAQAQVAAQAFSVKDHPELDSILRGMVVDHQGAAAMAAQAAQEDTTAKIHGAAQAKAQTIHKVVLMAVAVAALAQVGLHLQAMAIQEL